MIQRTDHITAARVDAVLILLPLIGWLETSCMLARCHVPPDIAARVISTPAARRKITIPSIRVV
jgi:hypothetical protein